MSRPAACTNRFSSSTASSGGVGGLMEKAGVGGSPPGHDPGSDKAFLTKSTMTDSSSPTPTLGDGPPPEP
ncbi:hypothetical protein I7I50_00535 [Histoplasma capsulatum G186AR]|uniref:Uncharacterized protein n=1 Tax=Ajellomyces capsulatus TaxID=5037 RepID=A0A8H7YGH2_AJECA|nr:hypothetical protein I7I52_07803 [Histoplasma capsulatum]QSS72624.1 hypothetical protein I7I50_00535 [Histoplasma capsulatum G186AR]